MKECRVCGSRDIYVSKNGVAVCLKCGSKQFGVQRPDYRRIKWGKEQVCGYLKSYINLIPG